MGSRSRPHRVLSVCVCVCVSRCLWVCVIEANSLQLRVITIGLYQFLSRSPSCQILAVCGRRLRGVSGSWFPRFLSPAAFLDSDRRRLVCPLLPCATRLSPYGKLRFCLRKAPFLPTESSASAYGKLRVCLRKLRPSAYGKLRLVSRCVLLLVINSLFPQLNPPVFIVTVVMPQIDRYVKIVQTMLVFVTFLMHFISLSLFDLIHLIALEPHACTHKQHWFWHCLTFKLHFKLKCSQI